MQRFLLSALLFCILAISTLSAQGAISGTVFDKASGETIIGASVVEKTTGAVTITDFDGKYSFELAAGNYNLEFSYIGYPNLLVESVEVKDGEITYQDVTMSDEEGIELGLDVTVTAERITNSEVGVLMVRKEALVVSDNISAKEMSRLGASDAGGALKKVTGTSVEGDKFIFVRGLGDRYSLTQLNGLVIPSTDPYRNSAQLDLVPTNLIDNISISKTSSPDQPGSFTGGSVNITTKKFPELKTFTISISGGFNNQSNLIDDFLTQEVPGTDYFGFDSGRAGTGAIFDPENRQYLNNTGVRDARRNGDERAANAIDAAIRSTIPQVAPKSGKSLLDHGLAMSYGNKFKMGENTLGLIATASFKQDYQNLDDFTTANWEVFQSDGPLFNAGNFVENRSLLNPTLAGLLSVAYRIGENNELSFTSMYNHTAETYSRTVFGERPDNLVAPRELQGFQLSHTEQEIMNFQLGGEHSFPKANNIKLEWRGSLVNSSQVEPQTRFFENSYNNDQDRYGFGGADTNNPFYFWRDLQDKQYTGKVDLTLPFAKAGSNIKIGAMIVSKDRESIQDAFGLERIAGGQHQTLDEVGGDQNVFVGPNNIGILSREENDRYNLGLHLTDRTRPRDKYTGTERVTAAYGMLTTQVTDKLKFSGGARLEITDIEVMSFDTTRAPAIIDVADILPSANFIYEVINDFNIRASYSKTIARPTMREISTFEIIDPLTSSIEKGNPDSLGRSLIDNFDLRLEYFLGGSEVVALSGYYKNFTNPIVRVQLPVSPNNEFQYQNVESGYIFGVEFELRKKLGFISTALQNFTFSTNAAYIVSETVLGQTANTSIAITERSFVGQPDYILNAVLNYGDIERGWDISLALNRLGDRITSIGSPSGVRRDQITRARTQLDLVLNKKFGKVNLRLAGKNLLNDPYLISTDFNGEEFIFSNFKRGLDFRFSLGYTF